MPPTASRTTTSPQKVTSSENIEAVDGEQPRPRRPRTRARTAAEQTAPPVGPDPAERPEPARRRGTARAEAGRAGPDEAEAGWAEPDEAEAGWAEPDEAEAGWAGPDEAEVASDYLTRPATRRPGLLTLLSASLALVVVAALVLSVIEWSSQSSRDSKLQTQASLRHSALVAAQKYGLYLSSYNYTDLSGPNSSWSEVDAHSTASFRKDFDATKANLTKLVTDYKATASGTIIAAGVSSVSPSRAVALLFIDQKVTNTAQKPGSTTQPLRVELVMVRQHGQWLIDQLQVPN